MVISGLPRRKENQYVRNRQERTSINRNHHPENRKGEGSPPSTRPVLGSVRERNMKRRWLPVLAGLVIGLLAAPAARAQDYPSRQITLIAPWPAGGAVDAICRAVAPHQSERLG